MPDPTFLAWPFFDDEHRALARRLEGWAARTLKERAFHIADVDEACRRLVARLGRDRWLAACVPASHGGLREQLDVRTLCLVREILARHAALADFSFAMQGLGSAPITLFGTTQQKDRYLPPVRHGMHLAAFALSEPDAGSDVAAIATTATPDGQGWVLDGVKTFISNGGIADHYVVFARTGEAPGAKGLGAFIVDADAKGLEIAARIRTMAPHPLATIRLAGVRVPDSRMLAGPGEGFKVAMATLDVFRATVGAAALGLARRALDEAVERAASRRLFGERLADLQLTQARLADMATEIDAAALLVYRAAWTKDCTGSRASREASMAKMYATEAAQRVIDAAVQIFGGLGVTVGVKVEELYREIRALRIYEGATEVQKIVIARQVLAAHEDPADRKAAG
jgi:acyl-CoA dehydrogenase